MKMSTVKSLAVVGICFLSLSSLVGCTRVIRTDYIVSPVMDSEGQQVGEEVSTRTRSQYVSEI